jgi:hypothetical protein
MEMRLRFLCIGAIVFFLASPAVFASDDGRVLFGKAIALKEAGSESSGVFAEAARLFEMDASGDWRLRYEAGNARWWAGQYGQAIFDYRQYLARDAFRGEVWENLAEARRAAGTVAPGKEGFFSWPWHLWLAAFACFFASAAFLLFSLFVFMRKKSLIPASVGVLAVAVCLACGSAATLAFRKPVVVLAVETQGRKGDSSVYAPYPTTPWKEGQEAFVTETRDTWTRIIVGDTVSWVPSANLRKVTSRRQ